jgi:hypothetical protein
MTFSVNQVAPIIANAGLTQNISVTQNTGLNAAQASALTSTNAPQNPTFTNTQFGGLSLGAWIFIAAILYFFLR